MHFEILIEDQSGKKALDILVPKIIGDDAHTFKVYAYKGIGRIPRNMKDSKGASERILLENLPKLLKGYGRTFAGSHNYQAAVILVCDLDDKCLKAFRKDLFRILDACNPRPETKFCIAIEEGEAWFLGDLKAIKTAYPRAKDAILNSYCNDSICGTWEMLAGAVYPGGATRLSSFGYQAIGTEKAKWAETIAPHMDPNQNDSPSFHYFRNQLLALSRVNQ